MVLVVAAKTALLDALADVVAVCQGSSQSEHHSNSACAFISEISPSEPEDEQRVRSGLKQALNHSSPDSMTAPQMVCETARSHRR
jgi:hypothetical protein